MSIPATQQIIREPYTPGVNAHGAPTAVYGDPETLLVYGLAPDTSQTLEGDREPSTAKLEMYAPPGTPNGAGDRWTFQGNRYRQMGDAEDFSTGPWWSYAGLRIHLQALK